MPLLTAADVRAHVDTALDDTAIQAVIDRLDADLVQRAGPHSGPLTEVLRGGTPSVYLRRPVATLTSVREGATLDASTPALDLVAEIRLWTAEGRVERIGANPWPAIGSAPLAFAPLVEVVYDPVDDTAPRQRVLLELVRLDLAQSGRARERIGAGYAYTALDYDARRDSLIRELRPFLVLE